VNALAASLDGLAVSQTLLGQYEQASASVERALGVFSRNQDLDRLATSLGHYAEILEQQERFNEAKAAYAKATTVLVQRVATADGSQKQAIDDKTRLAFIFTSFGSMLFELGDEDADAMLTTAKSYWSDVASASPANQNEYARFLVTCVDKDQRDQALATTVAEIATQASPGNADFLATLAAAHFHSADVERAIELLDEAKGVRNGERGFDMFVRAMSLAKQDRVAEARKVRQSASEWLAKEMPGSATLRRLEAEAKEILEAKATDG
jgi:tetratricopeptide (TPR) repeat protein